MDDEEDDQISYTVHDIVVMHRLLAEMHAHQISTKRLDHEDMMNWLTDAGRLIERLPEQEDVWRSF
jgi:hypothetical protein|tara:strand:+ start:14353 stop:14550 length:198 start_codon:yes stop_codon:yes gene_type:complete